MRIREGDKMEEYQVNKIYPCAECRGSGCVSNPAWLDFMEKNPPGSLRSMSVEDYRMLLRKHKLVGEPEELRCRACDGSGIVAALIGLEDVPVVRDILSRLEKLENIKNVEKSGAIMNTSESANDENDPRQKFIDEFDEKFGLK